MAVTVRFVDFRGHERRVEVKSMKALETLAGEHPAKMDGVPAPGKTLTVERIAEED